MGVTDKVTGKAKQVIGDLTDALRVGSHHVSCLLGHCNLLIG